MVADKVDVFHAALIVLDERDSIATDFLHLIARTMQPSRLQGLFHVLEFRENALLHALVKVFEVAIPARLEIKAKRG